MTVATSTSVVVTVLARSSRPCSAARLACSSGVGARPAAWSRAPSSPSRRAVGELTAMPTIAATNPSAPPSPKTLRGPGWSRCAKTRRQEHGDEEDGTDPEGADDDVKQAEQVEDERVGHVGGSR